MLALDAEPLGDARSESRTQGSTGRRGRPRKWDSDADRKRAYRQRLAADLEEPQRLREELRNERRRASALRNEAGRQRRRADAAERRLAVLREVTPAADRLAEPGVQGLDAVGRVDDLRSSAGNSRNGTNSPHARSQVAIIAG